jgi:two-component system CheB/CheR fusion protein
MASRKPAATGRSKRTGSSGRTKPAKPGSGRRTGGNASPQAFPIVGIGASAGGLGPIQEFFQAFPPKPGIAFIVVQHMDPTRASDMVEILARRTSLKVVEAEDGKPVQPDTVYTIPPGRYLRVVNGRLSLTIPEEPRGLRLPVDVLFASIAMAGESVLGVILSGTGADGTVGLRAIRNQGGTILVQDPETAEYDGMPRSAIATGLVDFILPPEKLPEAILAVAAHGKAAAAAGRSDVGGDGVADILGVLHTRRNVDFSGYKKGTLVRRIERRVSLRRVAGKDDYLRLLQDEPEEVNALFRDLLIPVTRFFRDPESWVVLEREALKRIVQEAGRDSPIRAWVTGCATGEEAYSLAILLREMTSKLRKEIPLQIFASDLDKDSVDIARGGRFPESIAADVGPERLKRFFTRQDHHYVVNQSLRDAVIFAHQNVLADPPFSRLDLVTCRNVLIYLEAPMQQRVLEIAHFALKPGRFLLLGSSETVGPQVDLFQSVHKRIRLYRRLGTVRHERIRVPVGAAAHGNVASSGVVPVVRDNLAILHARQVVLERYAVATVILNRKLEILSLFGPTTDYLTQPSGALTTDISAWLKEGARTKLKVGIQSALRKNQIQTVRGLRFRRGTRLVTVTCTIEPLTGPPETDGLILVSFRDSAAEAAGGRRPRASDGEEPMVRHLEQELKTARDDLQTSVEHLENANEELRVTNEELLSVNEELQSSNEELETSREELQSSNEELSTVNAQLESKIFELQGATEDIANLLTSTQIPTLFLDQHLTIRRFTPAITQLFRLIPSDVGRAIEDIVQLADDPTLLESARLVQQQQQQQQDREITTHKGKVFLRRVLPFLTGDDRVEGVVVTYIDLSERTRADVSIREARDYFEAIVTTLREPMVVLDRQLLVMTANRAFYKTYGQEEGQVIGRRIFDLGDREWDTPDFRKPLEELVARGTPIVNHEIHRDFAGLGQRFICVNGTSLDKAGHAVVMLSLEDITTTVRAERARNETLRQLVSYEEKQRHRLALDLHDETGQYVTACLLGLASLRASASDPTGHALIGELQARAEELARHLHGISLQLRPTALDDHGLERALQNYAEAMSPRLGLEVDVQARLGGRRLPEYVETVLYRVVQEALTNVLKHANASKASILLSRKGRDVSLIIEDNGRGFDTDRALNGGGGEGSLGLRGMSERVILAGGTLTVESSPGAGTTLFVRMPVREDHDER